jgi:hypothetical protein
MKKKNYLKKCFVSATITPFGAKCEKGILSFEH